MSEYKGLCFTCEHWQGDKEKQRDFVETDDSGLCMDRFKGWALSGGCGISYEWLTVTVNGDATAECEVDANFGCNYYCKESPSYE